MEGLDQLQKEPVIKKSWLRVLLFLIAFLIGVSIFQAVAMVIYALINGIDLNNLVEIADDPNNLGLMVIITLFTFIVALTLVGVFRKFIDRKTIQSLGLELKGRVKDMFLGFLSGFLLIGLGFVILWAAGMLKINSIQYSSETILGGLALFILVALVEELVFRAYVLSNLMEAFNSKYLALFVSAILFALFHSLNPNLSLLAMFNLVLAGLVLGITYIYTKNIWFPVFLHISWNYFQGPIFGFEVSGTVTKSVINHNVIGSDFITGGEFGFEGSILLSGLLIVMVVFVDFILRKKRTSYLTGVIN